MPILLDPSLKSRQVYERTVIFDMIRTLEQVKERGYSDWQTLTSFLARMLFRKRPGPSAASQPLAGDTTTVWRYASNAAHRLSRGGRG